MVIKIDPKTLTGTLRLLAEKAGKAEGNTELVDTESEISVFKNSAQVLLNTGLAKDFTQEDIDKIFGLEKSKPAQTVDAKNNAPSVQMSPAELVGKIFSSKGYNYEIVKQKGSNEYECQYPVTGFYNGNKKTHFEKCTVLVNPSENSATIVFNKTDESSIDDDRCIARHTEKYDNEGRCVEEKDESFGSYTTTRKYQHDSRNNVIKEITEDTKGFYQNIERGYDDKNRIAYRRLLDKNDVEIESYAYGYDNNNRITHISIDKPDYENNTDRYTVINRTFSDDGKEITEKETDQDGNTYVRKYTDFFGNGHFKHEETLYDKKGKVLHCKKWTYSDDERHIATLHVYDSAGNLVTEKEDDSFYKSGLIFRE